MKGQILIISGLLFEKITKNIFFIAEKLVFCYNKYKYI